MKLVDFLALHGIRSAADIDARKGRKSRHDYLSHEFGLVNADRIIRMFEVASWDLTLPGNRSRKARA